MNPDTTKTRNVLLNFMLSACLVVAIGGCGSSGDSGMAGASAASASMQTASTNDTSPPGMGTSNALNSNTSAGSANSNTLVSAGITISIQRGGETSPPTGYVRVENDNAAISYGGSWSLWRSGLTANYSGGTADVSSAAGASATFTFNGTAVRWIGYSDTFSGIADVSIDGGNQTVVNGYATLPESQVMLYSASGLDPTVTHSLKIEVTGTHSLLALGANITVDAFDVLPPPPDTIPPNVAMTSPANGATVSGTVTVSANATDDTKVASVQFQLDGQALGAPLTSSPYQISWDTTGISNGSHTLTAVATDIANNSATSAPVTVNVSNAPASTPPTVGLTAPTNGATVSGLVTVSANASDSSGTVASVQFQLDGNALGSPVTATPYQISWDTTTAANGSHTLAAVATNTASQSTTSSAVMVTVSNSSGGTTTRIEDNDPAVAYTGTWIVPNDSSLSGGSAHESNTANSTATLTFTGTGVTWISYRCTCTAGISQVSVDGGAPTQVDTYAANPQPQAPVFSVSNLPSGTHTLKITVTGQYDPAGSTAYVLVDAFDVTN
jgi:hypothetical protein